MKQTKCEKCNALIKNCNFQKHTSACDGVDRRFVKSTKCKYCELSFDMLTTASRANHTRWCPKNPKLEEYKEQSKNINICITDAGRLKLKQAVLDAHKNGVYADAQQKQRENPSFKGKHHTIEARLKISQAGLSNDYRRLRRKIQIYNGISMDSTWEVEFAKRLDFIGVEWNRPKPLIWLDESNKKHHYFPDFFLPKYNVYVDPKNPYAFRVQSKKIKMLQMLKLSLHKVVQKKL